MAGKIRKAMKKFISMFAMAQMIIWSCAKPEIDSPAPVAPDTDGVVFTALADAAMTKADPAAGGVVSWTEKDEIGVYDGTAYVKAEIISIEGNKVIFSADVDENAGKYIAVSPYEFALTDNGEFTMDGENVKLNTAATAQTAGKQVVSIASTSAPTEPFAFKNVCNLLRFKVEKATVKQAKITGAAGTEKIAGVLSVDPSTGAATGTLTETAIVTEITPGVDNFIALAPGTSLPDGFTITLYGDQINDAGYEGEVASAGAIDLTGERARNRMINIGTIDGWIDNYKLWEAGKPIVIAGQEYSKESTGLNSLLLQTSTPDFDIANRLSDGRLDPKAYFLESTGEGCFYGSNWYNFGNSTQANTVLLVSRYDNALATLRPTQSLCLYNGTLCCKGINFDITKKSNNYIFHTYSSKVYDSLIIDNCKIGLYAGDNFLMLSGSTALGVKNVKIVNSKIQSFSAGRVQLIQAKTDFTHLENLQTLTLDNNVLYCQYEHVQGETDNAKKAGLTIIGDFANQAQINTNYRITNNTFYNTSVMSSILMKNITLNSLTVRGNIFYITSNNTGYAHIIQSTDATKEYTYDFEDNVTNIARVYYFNPYQEGAYQNSGLYISKSADLAFKKADLEKGIFIPVDKYAAYGAKQ